MHMDCSRGTGDQELQHWFSGSGQPDQSPNSPTRVTVLMFAFVVRDAVDDADHDRTGGYLLQEFLQDLEHLFEILGVGFVLFLERAFESRVAEELRYETLNHSQSVASWSVDVRAAEPIQCDETAELHEQADQEGGRDGSRTDAVVSPTVAMDQKGSRASIIKPSIRGFMLDDRSCSVLIHEGDRGHLTKCVLHISPNAIAVKRKNRKQSLPSDRARLCKMYQPATRRGTDKRGDSLFCSRVCMGQRDCPAPCIVIQPYPLSQDSPKS